MNDSMINNPDHYDILIVDDLSSNIMLLTRILEKQGYRVQAVTNGRHALKTVELRLPDLILLDVKMPGMDGYEVCRRLKANEHSRNVPVIFISAHGETEKKVEGFKVGGVDYISWPFETAEVVARIETHLRLQKLSNQLNQEVRERTEELAIKNRKLLANEQLFRALVENSPDYIARYDRECRRIYINPAIQELFGERVKDALGKTPADHPILPTPQVYIDHIRQVIETGTEKTAEIPHRTHQGEVHWSHIRFVPEFGPDDEVTSVLAIGRDIQEVKENEQRFKMLADNYPDFVVRYDRDGRYTYVNPAFEKALGISADKIIGTPPHKLQPHDPSEQIDATIELIHRAFDEGETNISEVRLDTVSGERICEIRLVPEKDATGNVISVLGIIRDITEQYVLEKERMAHVHLLESMNNTSRAIHNSNDLEKMMKDVLDVMLSTFDCDRAWLSYPVDPNAASWSIPLERTKPEYPGCIAIGQAIPMDEEIAEEYRLSLSHDGPLKYGPGTENALPVNFSKQHGIKSFISMVLYPKVGKPWRFGMHQCSYARKWTSQEENLFQEIGRRLEDALTSLLSYRNLQESEERYRQVFENSPVSIWEEDFSAVKKIFDDLKKQGVGDIEAWFEDHPELVSQCAKLVKIVDVNQAAIALHGAKNKDELLTGLEQTFTPESFEIFEKELIGIWNEETKLTTDAVVKTLAGDHRHITVYFSVCPGHEETLSKVIVSLVDITERKRNEAVNRSRLHLIQFAETHTLEELLEETMNEAERITNSLIGFYHLIEDDQKTIRLQSWSTRTKAEFCKAEGKGLHYPISESGVWAECLFTRKPVIHNDYASLMDRNGMPEGYTEPVRELVLPVLRGDEIKAIVAVGNKSSEYTDQDVESVSMLADLAWEIAERKKTEDALRFVQFSFDKASVGIHFVRSDGRIIKANPYATRILGYSMDELTELSVHDIDPDLNDDTFNSMWNKMVTEDIDIFERFHIAKNGSQIPVEVVSNPFKYEGQQYSICFIRDITERKQMEAERSINLKYFESMDRVNQIIQVADDLQEMMKILLDEILFIFDCDRAFLVYPCDPGTTTWRISMERCNASHPSILETGVEMPLNPKIAEKFRILLSEGAPVVFGRRSNSSVTEKVFEKYGVKSNLSMAIYPKIGDPWEFGIHQCAHNRVWKTEEIRLFEAIGRRLSDALTSLLSNRILRNNNEFLDKVVEHIPNMIFVKDAKNLSYVRFNRAGEQLLGYTQEELIGKTDYDFFPTEEADFFTTKDHQVLDNKLFVDIPEETILTKSKQERILHTKKIPILDETGVPQYLLGISEDITERKKLEEQLHQSQKMEAIGQLAGGVAHDFSNMLGVIIGYSELAIDKVANDNSLREDIESIQETAHRSLELSQQLLAFARKQTITPKILDLNKTVAGMLKLLRRLIGKDIDLIWRPGNNLGRIKMDPSQVDQILANLCVNARDAISGVGKVTIETQNAIIDTSYSGEHKGISSGEYVLLTVSDTGSGIKKQIKDKIFEPFYTTKAPGKGTGMGLATVYGIVKQNDGAIYVYSELGSGSTFKIYLPRHFVKTEQRSDEKGMVSRLQGNETILLVEDEGPILKMVKKMLTDLGYAVLALSNPEEAIHTVSENAGEIDILITDLIMPEMTGLDLMKEITSLYPEIKHLYMSGYTGNVIAELGVLEADANFLKKPFTRNQLATKVREILDSK